MSDILPAKLINCQTHKQATGGVGGLTKAFNKGIAKGQPTALNCENFEIMATLNGENFWA